MEGKPSLGGILVGYNHEDKEKIFGDLSVEEIGNIMDKISYEVAKVESYKENISSIIEKAFNESGIIDIKRTDAAKSKLIITKNGQLAIIYDINKQKEIFGELSKEEIASILTDIAVEMYQDEDYETNLHSIIEKVFRESGIDDSSRLNAVKSYFRATF